MTDSLPQSRQADGDDDVSTLAKSTATWSDERTTRHLRDGGVLVALATTIGGGVAAVEATVGYLNDLVDEMEPRDALERMLVQQLALCHHRAVGLSAMAAQQTTLDAIRIVNEAADRALGSYRRAMLALREYRAPYRRVNIGQLNQANQQNVVYVERTDPEKLSVPAKKRDDRSRHEEC